MRRILALLVVVAWARAGAEGRLTARPHPPGAAAAARGVLPLGLGGARDGRVFVPSRYDAARPAPLMVLLHGAGGSAERILGSFRDRAERDGIILLVPDSRDRTWDVVVQRRFGDDVSFIDRALEATFARWNIDPERVVVAGFSDGASYALSLGLANGDLFSRILAFSPGFAEPPALQGKPRVLISHGSEDAILEVGLSRRLVLLLMKSGYDVHYVEFVGGHRMPDAVLESAFSWLGRSPTM